MRQPDPRAAEHVAVEWRSGGPAVEPGLEYGPPITQPEIWYSYRGQPGAAERPAGHAVLRPVRARRAAQPGGVCPQLFPEAFTGGVGPHGAAPYDYDPANPSTTKFPPYYDGAFILGEFTQDTMREVRLDSQNRVFKINQPELRPGAHHADAAVPVRQPDGHGVREPTALLPAHLRRRLLRHQPGRRMDRFEYVKGPRAPGRPDRHPRPTARTR